MEDNMDDEVKVSRIPTPRELKPNYWGAEKIAGVIKKESEVLEDVMECLGCMDRQEDAGTIKQLSEIASGIKKHIETLQTIMKAYDGIK